MRLMSAPDDNASRCPLFVDLSLEERRDVLMLLDQKQYSAGEMILHEGLEVQVLWIIVHGECEVLKTRADGTEKQLAVYGLDDIDQQTC